jgi:PAS domain S-box-containing protein
MPEGVEPTRISEELLKHKKHLEPLLEITPTATVISDVQATVVAWNPAAERLFGYTPEEAIGRNLDDLVAKSDELHRAAVSYSERAIQKEDDIQTITRRTRKDGTLVDVELMAAPLLSGGEVVGMLGIYHDITELNRQQRFFEALLQVSPEAITVTNTDSTVRTWNPGAQRLFGYTAEEAIGRKIDDLVATRPDLHAEAARLDQEADRRGEIRLVTQRTRKDGSLVDVEVVGAPIVVGGEQVARYAIYHDIGELQEQRRYFQSLLEISPAAIVVTDLEAKVVSWNPAAESLFGYTSEEAMGRLLDDLVATRADLHDEAVGFSEAAARGESVRATARRNRKDGSLVDVLLASSPVVVGEERVGFVAMYLDISEVQQEKRWHESVRELSPTAIVTVDKDTRVTSWNPAAQRLFGYSSEEAVGRPLDDLVATTDEIREEAARYTARGIGGSQVRLITRRTRKDGSLVDVELLVAPVTVAGEPAGHSVIYHDISELQEQKRYFQSILEVSPAAIVVTDLELRVVSWNPAAEELYGYGAEEAVGRIVDDVVANRPGLHEEAVGFSEAAARGERVRATTARTRKDGSLVDVQMVMEPVVLRNERVGFVIIYHDISEVQRQRRYYETLVQSSPVAIALLDPEANVTSWNPAAEQLFGYTAEEAMGRNIDALVAVNEETRAEAEAHTRHGMTGRLVHVITKRTRKDGTLVDVEVFGAPVTVAGEPAGLYAMYHDIADLQRAREAAEAATEAKSAFLATMSHEIRTPLNAVIGMTGLLLDTQLQPEQRSYAEVIRSSGDALLGVINEILDFSKIEAGRLDLEQQPFDLRQCVESALELVAGSAGTKGLDLAYLIDPRTPATIVGDITRVRQILLNLLNNAVKFTDEGEVVLKVDATRLDSSDGEGGRYELHFAIRDTGIGIPEERMETLFEAFSQVDASTTRRYGGSGLGLAISKRLAEQMGGTVWAESRVGRGSTFHVTLVAEARPGDVSADLEAIPQLEGKRVLIVDDNATNREILRRQTESWGMVPLDSGSPTEALAWVTAGEPFDLAILDMQMPEMDGLALAGEIRRHRDVAALPLVMLTSLGRRERGESDVEFAAHLTKPIRPSHLYDILIGIFAPQLGLRRVSGPAIPPEPEPEEGPPIRILLAEDNAVNQRVALLVLQKLGYRADVAADGREAVEAVERQPYDVILMDVQMPEMDGLEATRVIRERWPEGERRPRIIAMTAGATEDDRRATLEAGMDDFVSKPIRQEELAAALARSAVPALDPDALDRLAETIGGPDALAELTRTFLDDSERLLSELRRSVEAGQVEEVRRHAHTLKSTAASFGATELSDLCRRLEALAQAGSLDGAGDLVQAIVARFAGVRTALEEHPA